MRVARSAGFALLAGLVVIVGFLIYFRYHGAAWLSRKLQHESWRTGWREKIAVLLEGFSDGLQGVRTWEDLAVLLAIRPCIGCWSDRGLLVCRSRVRRGTARP